MKKCVICETEFSEWGNNAQPVAEGRCCDFCNAVLVITARLNSGLPEFES